MVTSGAENKTVPSVSGRFVDIVEIITKKVKYSTHWIDIELDNDNMGPTKGIYLDADSYNAVSSIIALYRLGGSLKEGDMVKVSIDHHNCVQIELNGDPLIPVPADKDIYTKQSGSFEKLLDALRGKHEDVDYRDQAESDYFIKVRNLIVEHFYYLGEEDIKNLVRSRFLPELRPDCSFEEIYLLLQHRLNDKVIL